MENSPPEEHPTLPIETDTISKGVATFIDDMDVLFGSENWIQRHPGNLRFNALVRSGAERYRNTCHRKEKSRIIDDVLDAIRRDDGRFLVKSRPNQNNENSEAGGSGVWVEATTDQVYERTSRALRRCRRSTKKLKTMTKKEVVGVGGVMPVSSTPTSDESKADGKQAGRGREMTRTREEEEENDDDKDLLDDETLCENLCKKQREIYRELIEKHCSRQPK